MLFPNEKVYNRKIGKYQKWYQSKKDLFASIKNLHSLFYTIFKEEQPLAEEEITKTIEELIANKLEI